MEYQEIHQFVACGNMAGKTVGIFEDAATNHEAVNFGVFLVEFLCMGFRFNVAIDN